MRLTLCILLLLIPSFVSAEEYEYRDLLVQRDEPDTWSFVIAPSIGIPVVSGETRFNRIETSDVEVTLDETPGNIRPWVNLNFEGVHNPSRLGLALNLSLTDIENSVNGPDRFFSFDADFERKQAELFGILRIFDGESIADLYGGFRYTQYRLLSTGQDPEGFIDLEEEFDMLDPVVGLKIIPALTNDFSLYFQGDAGVGGDSDLMVSATTGLLWKRNDILSLAFLYRADWIDYEEDTPFAIDTITHGPMFGLRFEFGA